MASLEPLIPLIYHETQSGDSMLCAQHALNSLLQGAYFSAPDLSDIARRLDSLEESYDDDNKGTTSTNMDDTGFFSVQVLENALAVWGLGLARWRGENMRPYHDKPHTQLAFILNYQQHWYTLRRFGPALPNLDDDPGEGHWFNLNSMADGPEWVSKLYLGMVLQQAESDGYSVFAITQLDATEPLALSRTEADEVAETLPQPRSAAARPAPGAALPRPAVPPIAMEGFEDEDLELQAALQASMMSGSGQELTLPTAPAPASRPVIPDNGGGVDARGPGTDDPNSQIAQSMARSQALLQQMTNEQEMAQRELWSAGSSGPTTSFAARQQEREEEMIRRAIAESEAYARGEQPEESEGMDVDEAQPPVQHAGGFPDHRVYDDDDAELQAALKASLEETPSDWVAPELPSQPPARPAQAAPTVVAPTVVAEEDDDNESFASESTMSAAPSPVITMDEMRRRRLERFGG